MPVTFGQAAATISNVVADALGEDAAKSAWLAKLDVTDFAGRGVTDV